THGDPKSCARSSRATPCCRTWTASGGSVSEACPRRSPASLAPSASSCSQPRAPPSRGSTSAPPAMGRPRWSGRDGWRTTVAAPRLESRRTELPQEEAPLIGEQLLPLALGGPDAVPRLIVHPQQYRLAAGGRGLQTRRQLRGLPRRNAGIVDTGREQDRRVGGAIGHVMVRAHFVQ